MESKSGRIKICVKRLRDGTQFSVGVSKYTSGKKLKQMIRDLFDAKFERLMFGEKDLEANELWADGVENESQLWLVDHGVWPKRPDEFYLV